MSLVLSHFIQFVTACDVWPTWQNFRFDKSLCDMPKIFVKSSWRERTKRSSKSKVNYKYVDGPNTGMYLYNRQQYTQRWLVQFHTTTWIINLKFYMFQAFSSSYNMTTAVLFLTDTEIPIDACKHLLPSAPNATDIQDIQHLQTPQHP